MQNNALPLDSPDVLKSSLTGQGRVTQAGWQLQVSTPWLSGFTIVRYTKNSIQEGQVWCDGLQDVTDMWHTVQYCKYHAWC